MVKGNLFVIEGACDGIGKSTQYDLLSKSLIKDGFSVEGHHFPSYNTYHGAPVEEYLKGNFGSPNNLSPYFINSLYAVDRAIAWQIKLKKMYDNGKIILLDRYTTSSLIYQTSLFETKEEKKKFIDYVIDFEYKKIGIKNPDDVIFLHAPFDLVTEMRKNRKENDGVVNDIHEKDLKFMKKVYDSAMYVADYLSWNKIKCNDGNNMRVKEDIHEEIYQKIKKKIR